MHGTMNIKKNSQWLNTVYHKTEPRNWWAATRNWYFFFVLCS